MAGRLWQEFPGRPDLAQQRARATGGEFLPPFDVQWRIDDGPNALAAIYDPLAGTVTVTGGIPPFRIMGEVQTVTMDGRPGVPYPVEIGQALEIIDRSRQVLRFIIGSPWLITDDGDAFVSDDDEPMEVSA